MNRRATTALKTTLNTDKTPMKIQWLIRFEILACALLISGCASASKGSAPKEVPVAKEKPVRQRGWIGGSYKRAKASYSLSDIFFGGDYTIYCFPSALANVQKAAILTTALDTNTPAYQAGLREGDLILELGHHPVTDLLGFWRIVTQTRPGAALPVKAYRAGETLEFTVRAGREKYEETGVLSIGTPILEALHPIPTRNAPTFSLVALGYEKNDDPPVEFGSVEQRYRHACHPKDKQQGDDENWSCWLAIVRVSKGKKILAQEAVAEEKGPAIAAVPSYPPEVAQGGKR
jgi:PDZ domain-containing protein